MRSRPQGAPPVRISTIGVEGKPPPPGGLVLGDLLQRIPRRFVVKKELSPCSAPGLFCAGQACEGV